MSSANSDEPGGKGAHDPAELTEGELEPVSGGGGVHILPWPPEGVPPRDPIPRFPPFPVPPTKAR
jgi:hypothetical protein